MRNLALVLIAACSPTLAPVSQDTGPRGMRGDDHIEQAHDEDRRANELARWPDTRPGVEASNADQQGAAGRWYGKWDTTAEHKRLAAVHRSEAAQLQAEYELACGTTPIAVASVSPIKAFGVGGSDTPDGVVVVLSPNAGPPDRLLAAMRCHRAFIMLGRSADADDCPLDLPGIHIDASGEPKGIELTITIDDPKLVPELRRRAAAELEVHREHTATATQR